MQPKLVKGKGSPSTGARDLEATIAAAKEAS